MLEELQELIATFPGGKKCEEKEHFDMIVEYYQRHTKNPAHIELKEYKDVSMILPKYYVLVNGERSGCYHDSIKDCENVVLNLIKE